MALLNYPTIWHVTKYRAIKIEMGVLHQLDQSQIFSRGHNFIDKTFKHCKINKNRHHLIIHRFGRVTTYWLFFQKAPLFIFIWLLKWSCLGHNMMNQAKYPEYQVGQVDIAVEQCGHWCLCYWWAIIIILIFMMIKGIGAHVVIVGSPADAACDRSQTCCQSPPVNWGLL